MPRTLHCLLSFSILLSSKLMGQSPIPGWLPKPSFVASLEGSLTIRHGMPVSYMPGDPELERLASLAALYLQEATGAVHPLRSSGYSTGIRESLHIRINASQKQSPEGYSLLIGSDGITLSAEAYAGLFRGLQTIRQLLQDGLLRSKDGTLQLPALNINDKPRFGWRGLMVDVARHFFGKDDMKHVIDEMARYKLNVLHLHLSDDEGWRIQIRSFPKLTSVGAWRPARVGIFGTISPAGPGEKKDYGGFYTQEDIRELVAYAKERYIDILPEIDVPGHSLAAVVSYPQLSCTPEASGYRIRVGEPIRRWQDGRPISFVDNTLCPANEQVYVFLDSVIRELTELFPFPYLHVGGDECAWNYWEKSDAVSQLMKEKGLKDMPAVQAYFTTRVHAIVTARGKKPIGWDEIVDHEAPKGSTIMAWQEKEAGVKASNAGFPVILTPRSQCYLDYMQGDPVLEQPDVGIVRLSNAFSLDPLPSGIDPTRVLGVQANLWTEHVLTASRLDYLLWPRALAVAEIGWSGKDTAGWKDFCRRVEAQFPGMDKRHTFYSRSLFDPIIRVKHDGADGIIVELQSEAPDLQIHYSFDFSHPNASYPVYTSPLRIPKDAKMLKLVTSRHGKLIGRQMDIPIDALRLRADFPITLWERVTSPAYIRRWLMLLGITAVALTTWLLLRMRRARRMRASV